VGEHILSFPALTAATYQKEKLNEAGGAKTFWAAFRHRLALAFPPQFPHFPIGFPFRHKAGLLCVAVSVHSLL